MHGTSPLSKLAPLVLLDPQCRSRRILPPLQRAVLGIFGVKPDRSAPSGRSRTGSRVAWVARLRGGFTRFSFPSFALPFALPLARFGQLVVPRHQLLHDPLPFGF